MPDDGHIHYFTHHSNNCAELSPVFSLVCFVIAVVVVAVAVAVVVAAVVVAAVGAMDSQQQRYLQNDSGSCAENEEPQEHLLCLHTLPSTASKISNSKHSKHNNSNDNNSNINNNNNNNNNNKCDFEA